MRRGLLGRRRGEGRVQGGDDDENVHIYEHIVTVCDFLVALLA
jgi:hypothetical protein